MARETMATLREKLADAERNRSVYQEAFLALRRGEKPIVLSSGLEGSEYMVELFGLDRACGGIVIQNGSVSLVDDWRSRITDNSNPYLRDLRSKVDREREKVAEIKAWDKVTGFVHKIRK